MGEIFRLMVWGMIGWAAFFAVLALIQALFKVLTVREWARAKKAHKDMEEALATFRQADDKTKAYISSRLEELERRQVRHGMDPK